MIAADYIQRANAATVLYEQYSFRFVKRANEELYKILSHVYKLYLDIVKDPATDEILKAMRAELKSKYNLKLTKKTPNASVVVRFATLTCTKTTSIYSRVIEIAREEGIAWEHFAEFVSKRGGIDKVRKAVAGIEEQRAAKAAMHASRDELKSVLWHANLGNVQLAPAITTVASGDTEFFQLLCMRDTQTRQLKIVASLYPSSTLEADALHHFTIACRAAAHSDKHGFKEYCESNGLRDDMVLHWMAANGIKDAQAARMLLSQLGRAANESYQEQLAEAA